MKHEEEAVLACDQEQLGVRRQRDLLGHDGVKLLMIEVWWTKEALIEVLNWEKLLEEANFKRYVWDL